MKLKLLIEHTGQSFTLKPEIKYIVGSALDCTINLPNIDGIAERHIALSFVDNAWQVEDLNSTNGTFVNGQAISTYRVDAPVRIALAGNFLIAAAPLVPEIVPLPNTPIQPIQPPTYQPPITPPPVYGSSPTPVYNPQSISSPSPYNAPYTSTSSPPPIQQPIPTPRNQFNRNAPRVITWWEFIDRQVEKGQSWLDKVAIRFFMTTGLRSTPWLELSNGNGLDGYIIPDFKENADEISLGIASSLDKLRQYPDTDCSVVWLTDAHVESFQPSPMLAVPIKRASRKDFRRFCVVSHHRIRTYVIIDNYGTDLFVGRITRFEAQLNGFPLLMWGIIFAIMTIFLSFGSGFLSFAGDLRASVFIWLLIILSGLWSGIFLGIPLIMRQGNALPVPTNTSGAVILMLFLVTIFVLLLKILFPS